MCNIYCYKYVFPCSTCGARAQNNDSWFAEVRSADSSNNLGESPYPCADKGIPFRATNKTLSLSYVAISTPVQSQ